MGNSSSRSYVYVPKPAPGDHAAASRFPVFRFTRPVDECPEMEAWLEENGFESTTLATFVQATKQAGLDDRMFLTSHNFVLGSEADLEKIPRVFCGDDTFGILSQFLTVRHLKHCVVDPEVITRDRLKRARWLRSPIMSRGFTRF